MRMRLANLAMCLSLMVAGCASIASTVSGVAVSLSSSSATQATTVAEATQAVTIAEQALDVYVKTGNPSKATLNELSILVQTMHATLLAVQDANKSGNSAATAAAFSLFNQALAAYNSYVTLVGISH